MINTLQILMNIIQVFQIVYDTVKLEVLCLSKQLGTAGIHLPKNLTNKNSVSSRISYPKLKNLEDANALDFWI